MIGQIGVTASAARKEITLNTPSPNSASLSNLSESSIDLPSSTFSTLPLPLTSFRPLTPPQRGAASLIQLLARPLLPSKLYHKPTHHPTATLINRCSPDRTLHPQHYKLNSPASNRSSCRSTTPTKHTLTTTVALCNPLAKHPPPGCPPF